MVSGPFPGTRDAVGVGAAGFVAQRVGHQGQVDAQAKVAAKAGLTVIPPAAEPAFAVMQAIRVVQAQA